MQILYLRIESRKIMDVPKELLYRDLNLSSEYTIKLLAEELSVKKKNIQNFYNFKNISTIKAIVGKNGSGKSKLLSLITTYLQNPELINAKINFIICVKENNELIAISNGIPIKGKKIKIVDFNEYKKNPQKYIKNKTIIFASNSFSWDNYFPKSGDGFYNISFDDYIREPPITYKWTNNQYNNDYIDSRFKRPYIEERKNKQKIKNIKFINETSLFDIPNITISLDYIYHRNRNRNELRIYNYQTSISKMEKKIYDLAEKKFRKETTTKKEKVKLFYYIRIIDMLFDELINKIHIPEVINHFLKKLDKEKNLKYTKIDSLIKVVLEEIENYKVLSKFRNIFTKKFVKGHTTEELDYFYNIYVNNLEKDFKNIKEKYQNLISKLEYIFEISKFKLGETGMICVNQEFYNYKPFLLITKEYYNDVIEFLEFYNNNFSSCIFEVAYPSVSAGINARMNLYVNLYERIISLKNVTEIILLLDEPDLYFHPEWKRKFLKDLIEFLGQFEQVNFQLIITTNEPYMISDLNRNSIMGLDCNYDENSRIFASNIYDLLKNQYFMDKYIGDLAMSKINELIKESENCNNEEKFYALQSEIDEIGDNIIRGILLEKLEKYYDKNKSL